MITIDFITLMMIACMFALILLIAIFDNDYRDDREYRKLKKKYDKLKESYLELMNAFEQEELRES